MCGIVTLDNFFFFVFVYKKMKTQDEGVFFLSSFHGLGVL
jgi:hypothetical protein